MTKWTKYSKNCWSNDVGQFIQCMWIPFPPKTKFYMCFKSKADFDAGDNFNTSSTLAEAKAKFIKKELP